MKNKKILKTSIIILIIIVIISSLLIISNKDNIEKKNNSKIKIGFITSLTGPISYLGIPDKRAVELAEEKIKEIYNSEDIEVIIEDSQSNVAQAAVAANKLITIDDVDVIYVEFSGTSGSVVPITKDHNKLVIYSSYRTDLLDEYKYSIKTYRNAESECKDFAKIAKDKGVEKIAILQGVGGTMAQNCYDGTTNYYDKEDIKIVDLIDAKQDMKTVLLKLQNEGYFGLFSCLYESSTISYYKSKLELGLNDFIFFSDASNGFTDKIQETIGKENISNVIVSELDYSKEFKNKYIEKYNNYDGVSDVAPMTYDLIIKLYSSIKKCRNNNKECIIENTLDNKTEENLIMSRYKEPKNRSFIPKIKYSFIENGIVNKLEIN